MNPSTVVQLGAKASIVLVFFAFPVSVALANVGLLLTLVFWLLGCIWGTSLRDTRQALSNPLVPPALALFAWIVLATLWSPADGSQIGAALQKYSKFLMVPIFIGMLHDATTRRRCWQAFALAMLFTLTVTWLNVWFDFPWTRTHNQGFGQDHTVFKDYISQGIMVSFFTLMALHHALSAPKRSLALLAVCVAGLAACSVLFLSAGRTGYLALMLSLTVFVLVATAQRPVRLIMAAVAVVAVIASVFATSTQLRTRTLVAWQEAQTSSLAAPVTSIGARVEMTRFALTEALEKPLQGHGTAAYPVLSPQHFTDQAWCSVVCVHPHNQFVFFLFEQGLIGLLLFLWFLAAIARQAWREPVPQRALMLGFLAVLVASNMTHSSFWLSTENHFFILLSVLLMAAVPARLRSTLQPSREPV
jgi:O-antigen ligase